jgi:hypothetical protein
MTVYANRLKQQDSRIIESTYDYFAPKFSFVCDATGVRITQLPITPEKLIKELMNGGFRTS